VTFGFAQGIISCVFALIFFLAALFIRDYHVGVLEAYTAIYAIMFAAISAGGNLGFLGGISDSKVALVNVMNILNNQELAEEYGKGAIQ
jgi:ATP-binding cassette subfamily B (MDR/TAP) protein 1